MKAWQHTWHMLGWWAGAEIDRIDLLVKRTTGVVVPSQNISIHALPLPWVKAENANGAEIYIRPARGRAWPLVFLDDVETNLAYRIAGKYAALIVPTSLQGGCHIWLRTTQFLNEKDRYQAQRWLAHRTGADKASVSGEHFGRLAGMKNWKRQGAWVNVVQVDYPGRRLWNPAPVFRTVPDISKPVSKNVAATSKKTRKSVDQSESGKEWGWVCGAIQAGVDPDAVFRQLHKRAIPRRGKDAERYARHTIIRALKHIH